MMGPAVGGSLSFTTAMCRPAKWSLGLSFPWEAFILILACSRISFDCSFMKTRFPIMSCRNWLDSDLDCIMPASE
jgi:hypothetical protein